MAGRGSGKVLTYFDGAWRDGNTLVLGPRSHGMWLASTVFDGARALQGAAPDLDRHCARLVESARVMGLSPRLAAGDIEDLIWAGIRRFPKAAELYICPMFFAEAGFIVPEPESTGFVLALYESPLPPPDGFSAGLSSYRRPARDMAPTDAKASCLYPNVARVVREARANGFDSGVVLDPSGNVAEFAYANLFLVKDGVVHTPVPNGTFLDGITRQRVIALLRDSGVAVVERTVTFAEVAAADELFATGNYAKVAPCTRIGSRSLQPGPVMAKARRLYFEFAAAAVRR